MEALRLQREEEVAMIEFHRWETNALAKQHQHDVYYMDIFLYEYVILRFGRMTEGIL